MLFHFLFLHHILYPVNISIDLLILYYCITIVSQMLFFVCLQYHYNFCKQQILIWAADLGFVFIAFCNGFNSFFRRDSISITDLPHRYPNSHSFIISPVTPAAWNRIALPFGLVYMHSWMPEIVIIPREALFCIFILHHFRIHSLFSSSTYVIIFIFKIIKYLY